MLLHRKEDVAEDDKSGSHGWKRAANQIGDGEGKLEIRKSHGERSEIHEAPEVGVTHPIK